MVITIIAVIFSVGAVSFAAINKNSRDARRIADMEAIRQALEMCRSIAGEYPSSIYPLSGSIVCTDSSATVTMRVTLVDPKPCLGHEDGRYQYVLTASGYSVTADCMEDEGRIKTVYSP